MNAVRTRSAIAGVAVLAATWLSATFLIASAPNDADCQPGVLSAPALPDDQAEWGPPGGGLSIGTFVCIVRRNPSDERTVVRLPGGTEEFAVSPDGIYAGDRGPRPNTTTEIQNLDAQDNRQGQTGVGVLSSCQEHQIHCLNINFPGNAALPATSDDVAAPTATPGKGGGSIGTNVPTIEGDTARFSTTETPPVAVLGTGSTPTLGGGNAGPLSQDHIGQLYQASAVAEEGAGVQLAQAAVARRRAVHRTAEADHDRLAARYANITPDAAIERLQRAGTELRLAGDALGQGESDLVPAAASRFSSLYHDASARAFAAAGSIGSRIQTQDAQRPVTLFDNLFGSGSPGNNVGNQIAQEVASFFEAPMESAATYEAAQSRAVMFYGLPQGDRQRLAGHLQLAADTNVVTTAGERQVTILHAGYLLGKTDCSSFVSEILMGNRFRFTTADLRAVYDYHRQGQFPRPPRYTRERMTALEEAAQSLHPVHIRRGERLIPGDLLFSRRRGQTYGHVVMVTSYEPGTMRTKIVEASGSAGTVRERDYQLGLPAFENRLVVRPGIMALRMSAGDNGACRSEQANHFDAVLELMLAASDEY